MLSPNAGMPVIEFSFNITLSIELNNISGGSCNLNDLWVQYVLQQDVQSQPYKVGRNEHVFNVVPRRRTNYSYHIRITINNKDVIANFSGNATFSSATSECTTNG